MYYIGVDLGGTNIAVGIVSEEGNIIMHKSIPTLRERGIELVCEDIINLCKQMMVESNLSKEDIHSVGVGTPGYVDSKNGVIVYASNLNVNNFEIVKVMGEALGIPVFVGNDADCAALGEVTSGIAKGCNNAIILTLGTGVGGGIIINGRIFSGSFPGGGELGHQVIEVGGIHCPCGRDGCLEMYTSATALIKFAKEAAMQNPESMLNQLVNGDLTRMNAKIPFDAAENNDTVAQEVIDKYMKYLAIGIGNLVNVFKPEMIVLGGGVAAQKENLTIPLTNRVKKEIYAGDMQTKIETATLGNDAGIIGAAMLGK